MSNVQNTPKLKILSGLGPHEYEHPFDRKALDSLQKIKGFDYLVRKYNEYISERVSRLVYTGSFIKVNQESFPDLYKVYLSACKILDLNYVPELYLIWGYDINAHAFGVERPSIALYSGCLEFLSQQELLWMIGHELGHIKSGHMLYHDMAHYLPKLSAQFGAATLGLSNILTSGLELGLFYWSRMSEFTADRSALLTCQQKDVSIKTLAKMAGLPRKFYSSYNYEMFLNQAKDFKDFDDSTLNIAAKIHLIRFQSHPWTVMRASELMKWLESGMFHKVLKRETRNEHSAVTRLPSMLESRQVSNKIHNIAQKEKEVVEKIRPIIGEASSDLHLIPDIPMNKLLNAIQAYAKNIRPEDVLLLCDGTLFGGSKEGFLLTKELIHGQNSSEENPFSILLSDIRTYCYKKKDGFFSTGKFLINNSTTIEIYEDEIGVALERVLNLLTCRQIDNNVSDRGEFCISCGTKVQGTGSYCVNCGTKLQ